MLRSRMVTGGVLALLLAVVAVGCGGNEDTIPSADTGKAPATGERSAQFGLLLPQGAKPEPASASGGEAYRAGSEHSLLDVNAFFQKEVDGRDLNEFAWCGAAGFASDRIVRIWKKRSPAGELSESDQLIVELIAEPAGVLITAREDQASAPATCPPTPPTSDQPFESPGN